MEIADISQGLVPSLHYFPDIGFGRIMGAIQLVIFVSEHRARGISDFALLPLLG
jgi:hypothetical protein